MGATLLVNGCGLACVRVGTPELLERRCYD